MNTGVRGPLQLWERYIVILCVAFLAILVVKFSHISDLPVWDAAFSVFPAGNFLAETGFDFRLLLSQPGYYEVGQNVHGLSFHAVLIGVMFALFVHVEEFLPLLHTAHFLFAALAITSFYFIARRVLSWREAALLTLAFATTPVVLTQFGVIYTETLLMAVTLSAFLAYLRGKTLVAISLLCFACWVRPTAVLAVSGLMLTIWLSSDASLAKRLKQVAVISVPPILILSALFYLGKEASPTSFTGSFPGCIRPDLDRFLFNVPDVLLLGGLAIALASLLLKDHLKNEKPSEVYLYSAVIVFAFLIFHFVFVPLVLNYCFVLPRYYNAVIPFCYLCIAWGIKEKFRLKSGQVIFASLLALNILNYNGSLYPEYESRHGQNLSISERSNEYRELLHLAMKATRSLEERGEHYPIYADIPYAYYLKYEANGYVESSPKDLRPLASLIDTLSDDDSELNDDCAYFVPQAVINKNFQMQFFAQRTREKGTHELTLYEGFKSTNSSIEVLQLARVGAQCP